MKWILLCFIFINTLLVAQQTKIYGVIIEAETNNPIPFAKIFFKDSKIGTVSDIDGNYTIETYYATDSLIFRASGFTSQVVKIKKDQSQELNISLKELTQTTDVIEFYAPKEKPSTTLHKRIVRNKPINNKEKLEAYEYENYSKIQLDLNNLGEKFGQNKVVQNLSLIMDYLDTINGGTYLPFILSESISTFYKRSNPNRKKEVISASRITGVENIEFNQFLGDMYQDINVYDNYIGIFDKSFISPTADFARSFYTFFLKDSAYIENQWCYLMTFSPKRTGDLTFEGEMWIHDTTYAVKEWKATVNSEVNINYVNSFYFEQKFEMIEHEVWMLTYDRLIVDLKITQGSKIVGFLGRKLNTRKNFVINKPYPIEFYNTSENVVIAEGAKKRSEEYWQTHRHVTLNEQEEGIENMIDSLNNVPLFKFFKNITFLATTGFYPVKKFEFGNIKSLISYNRVEGLRNQFQLRTSNDFSRRIQFFSKIAYGYNDKQFKYGGGMRYNITPKKRGMLDVYYDSDIKQLGLGENADDVDAAFGSLFRTKPLTKLTYVEKLGISLEKDLGKSFIITTGAQWKKLSPLGNIQFIHKNENDALLFVNHIQTFETSFKIRYAKKEEFISGAFDRISISSQFPIISLATTLGIKNVLGSEYNYQKFELKVKHNPRLGIFGTINYEFYSGIYFGQAPYPFLKIHEGSQSFWFQSMAHNRMDYYEFISDKYIGANVEHHFNGLILDRVPLIKKLKWRLVVSSRAVIGSLSDKQKEIMLLPQSTTPFGGKPYVESSVGIENIFKVFRVDAVWRMTHLYNNMPPVAIRAKFEIRF